MMLLSQSTYGAKEASNVCIPHEVKVDVTIPTDVFFKGCGEVLSVMKIKLMLLPQSTLVIEGGEL